MIKLLARRLAQMVLIMAVISLVIFFIFDSDKFKKQIAVAELGNFGVAVARLTAFASTFVFIFFVEKRFFGRIQTSFWLSLTVSLAVAAVAAALVEIATTKLLPFGWPTLLLSVFLGGTVYCSILWLFGYITADDRQLIRNIVSRAETRV